MNSLVASAPASWNFCSWSSAAMLCGSPSSRSVGGGPRGEEQQPGLGPQLTAMGLSHSGSWPSSSSPLCEGEMNCPHWVLPDCGFVSKTNDCYCFKPLGFRGGAVTQHRQLLVHIGRAFQLCTCSGVLRWQTGLLVRESLDTSESRHYHLPPGSQRGSSLRARPLSPFCLHAVSLCKKPLSFSLSREETSSLLEAEDGYRWGEGTCRSHGDVYAFSNNLMFDVEAVNKHVKSWSSETWKWKLQWDITIRLSK